MQESASGFHKAILYAGAGLTDLYPATSAVPKCLLPIYDKPLIYYSLSILMLSGIRRVAVVTRPGDQIAFRRLLGDGHEFGVRIEYLAEATPHGPAQSLLAARDFIGRDNVAVILGDSLIYGDGLQRLLSETTQRVDGATAFAHPVNSPRQHAIVELADDGTPKSIEERPEHPKSNLAITGIFFYDHQVVDIAAAVFAAKGRDFSLTDVNRQYLENGSLRVRPFGRGFVWLDTSTHASLTAAANFIETIESTHGLKIACLEEIAYRKGFVSADAIFKAAARMNNAYGQYLEKIARSGPELQPLSS
ncbi:MAG TPA: sugar phosphate nucleotidyltransferase [Pirellulales bacterium]|jgi:glucose-1-phosphate thymidylyltransferase|nr:sugar phosphate nucleotidyltransferase [Pirellulales bacterium]